MLGEHERLGRIALRQGRPADALAEFQRERALRIDGRGIETRIAEAYRALGRRDEAVAHYRAELRLDPGDDEARTALATLGAAP
jgi:Flp pilus assembly protein TadD